MKGYPWCIGNRVPDFDDPATCDDQCHSTNLCLKQTIADMNGFGHVFVHLYPHVHSPRQRQGAWKRRTQK